MDEDAYFKKIITFNFWRQNLRFRTSQELFSSHEIDSGTRLLLRTIKEDGNINPQSILDMGCGYGPLGLTLKSVYRDAEVHLVDRDALAFEYSGQNAELNGFTGVSAYGSLGYDDLKKSDFDLIVSNLPGKAGEPVIAYLLRDAAYHLAPHGLAAIVVVTPLAKIVEQILKASPGAEITNRQTNPGHVVFHYRFQSLPGEKTPPAAMERGIFTRKQITFRLDSLECPLHTAFGIPEFDTLDYRSEMLLKAVENLRSSHFKNIVAINPGQGYIPIAIWKIFQTENISLVDRDLLALRYAKFNLVLNQCPAERINLHPQAGFELKGHHNADLWIGVLRSEEGSRAMIEMIQQAAQTLSPTGSIVLSASSTAMARLADYIQLHKLLRIVDREKWRGYSLLVLSHYLTD